MFWKKGLMLSISDHVVIQHPISKCWSTSAVVLEIGPNRDYLLKTPAGRLFRLNHRLLRKRILVLPGTKSAPTPMPPSPAPPEVSPKNSKPHKRS
jgi:hypothetical protein